MTTRRGTEHRELRKCSHLRFVHLVPVRREHPAARDATKASARLGVDPKRKRRKRRLLARQAALDQRKVLVVLVRVRICVVFFRKRRDGRRLPLRARRGGPEGEGWSFLLISACWRTTTAVPLRSALSDFLGPFSLVLVIAAARCLSSSSSCLRGSFCRLLRLGRDLLAVITREPVPGLSLLLRVRRAKIRRRRAERRGAARRTGPERGRGRRGTRMWPSACDRADAGLGRGRQRRRPATGRRRWGGGRGVALAVQTARDRADRALRRAARTVDALGSQARSTRQRRDGRGGRAHRLRLCDARLCSRR